MADVRDNVEWRKRGAHLPAPLRDFHDQKDVFKTVQEMYERDRANKLDAGGRSLPEISWVDAHIYTVDFFLWFMARHGWTLQRSKARVAFADLDATVKARRDRDDKEFASALGFTSIPLQDDSNG